MEEQYLEKIAKVFEKWDSIWQGFRETVCIDKTLESDSVQNVVHLARPKQGSTTRLAAA